MQESRLVIGAGGTGKTHQLQKWVDELSSEAEATSASAWLAGNPLRPVGVDQVKQVVSSETQLIVADDLQWFAQDALEALLGVANSRTMVASRRPAVGARALLDLIGLLDEELTRQVPASRVGLLDQDSFAVALASIRGQFDDGASVGRAMSTDEVVTLHNLTGGSLGLAIDIVSVSWSLDPETVPAVLIDAVLRRVRRAGPEAEALASLWAVATEVEGNTTSGEAEALSLALSALDDDTDPGRAERGARAGGLVGDAGTLIPLVRLSVLADLVRADRAALHGRLAEILAPTNTLSAARHLLAGHVGESGSGPVGGERILASAAVERAGSDPAEADRMLDRAIQLGLPEAEAALLRGLTAFQVGSNDALSHLETVLQGGDAGLDARAALLSYGLDLRELRFSSARGRSVQGELAEPLSRLAGALNGEIGPGPKAAAKTPIGQLASAMADAVVELAKGEASESLSVLSTAADDFDRLRPTAPFGITPHALGALTGIVLGDLAAVDLLCQQAADQSSGGQGEQLTHQLIQAYGQLVDGDYNLALALLRQFTTTPPAPGEIDGADEAGDAGGPSPDGQAGTDRMSQRDRLLVAALEAAIARRSGDTGRLRAAWARAEEALIRQSASWLFIDFFTELLACGSRLGDERRVEPVAESLCAQCMALPATGPGPVNANWLQLQIAVASEDNDRLDQAVKAMEALEPTDPRSRARVGAATAWSAVIAGTATEELVTERAAQLTAIGDGWEASRLLGQAALDENDPKAARRLLELARLAASDQVDDSTGDGLAALGLSEREAEVAVLVAEGRTHKEVGAQLFISPKTVEHHVAKIRQKLGAASRAELLSTIREALD
ncbi:MAG: hypothetical protein GY724_26920 [Actinomycetia bacterium]|nr:hypothetical protein [Actinomycetes bacterium]